MSFLDPARGTGRFVGLCLAFLLFAVLGACAAPPAPGQPPLTLPAVDGTLFPAVSPSPAGSATPTLNSCMPCGSQAATMTARIPATQTAVGVHQTQTAVAPGVQATLTAVAALSATPTAEITELSEACSGSPVCILNGHFLFQRPIPLTGPSSVERSYPYGSTQDGKREVHHGVEFYNPQGTPVLAAADGEVVFAGDDKLTLIAWVTGFYGNVVVLRHNLGNETFYTLYGHLYQVNVTAGQNVLAGEPIGTVGATGTAIGSHLHFEVRRGENDYKSTRNPELWLAPLEGTGVLAGSIVDEAGNAVKGMVNVQRLENGILNPLSVGSVATYPRETINSDDGWQETFVLGELPAGQYRLSLVHNGVVYEQVINIEPGRLTLVRLQVR